MICTDSWFVDGFDLFCFCPDGSDLSELNDPLNCAFVKSNHGMSTTELMEVHNDDHVVDIINCVALYYEKGASGNAFLREEKFRAAVSRQVKTLKVLKETVR